MHRERFELSKHITREQCSQLRHYVIMKFYCVKRAAPNLLAAVVI